MRAAMTFAALTGLALQAGNGSACLRAATWTLVGEKTPAPSSIEVPLDAPIVVGLSSVTLDGAAPGSAPPGYSVLAASLTNTADNSTQSLHELDLAYDDGPLPNVRAPVLTAFVPDAPLLPNTTYAVTIGQDTELTNPNADPKPTTWTFTTGSEPRAPLRFKGELSVSFEAGLDPHMDCQIPLNTLCGAPVCTQDGTDHVIKARIQLPAVLDGYSDQFLTGQVSVRDAAAADDQPSGVLPIPQLMPGESSEILMTVPLNEAKTSYVPCFTFSASDARGDATVTSWCADVPFPLPSANDDAPRSSGSHTSRACSVDARAPGGGGGHSGWAAGLLALLATRKLRSRRQRRAVATRSPG
jgi:hypothetical protein